MSDRVLTKEIRDQLLGLAPFSNNARFEFTPECYTNLDIPEEYKPVFIQRSYTKGEKNSVLSLAKKAAKNPNNINDEQAIDYARMTITGLKNFFDAGTGEEICFEEDEKGFMCKDQFENLPVVVQSELSINAMRISGMINDLEKLGLK